MPAGYSHFSDGARAFLSESASFLDSMLAISSVAMCRVHFSNWGTQGLNSQKEELRTQQRARAQEFHGVLGRPGSEVARGL